MQACTRAQVSHTEASTDFSHELVWPLLEPHRGGTAQCARSVAPLTRLGVLEVHPRCWGCRQLFFSVAWEHFIVCIDRSLWSILLGMVLLCSPFHLRAVKGKAAVRAFMQVSLCGHVGPSPRIGTVGPLGTCAQFSRQGLCLMPPLIFECSNRSSFSHTGLH